MSAHSSEGVESGWEAVRPQAKLLSRTEVSPSLQTKSRGSLRNASENVYDSVKSSLGSVIAAMETNKSKVATANKVDNNVCTYSSVE